MTDKDSIIFVLKERNIELEKQLKYYKGIAEKVGKKRIREIEFLNRLIYRQKQAEEALIHTQRLSAVGELASGVAHDFNNSLQVIFGYIELALLSDSSSEVEEYLKTIKRSASDAASRVRRLHRFSGKSKKKKNYEKVNLNSLVQEVVAQTKPLWKDESERAGINIEVIKNFTEMEIIVDADAGELRSILYNMIKNSVQAMPEGGKLTFETGKIDNSVYVTVTDTGTGMDEETKTRIFQPFFTTKGFEQGKGLGMSTSYAIAREHNGKLYVKDSPHVQGTSIELLLPISGISEKKQGNTISKQTSEARILWVDDEKGIRDMGKKLLELLNHSADIAGSGEEALTLIQNNKYDLVITDIGMSNMNGWQLANRIKENYSDMKVAIVTGWEVNVSREEKEQYGICNVLGKPIDKEQLKNMISEVLN